MNRALISVIFASSVCLPAEAAEKARLLIALEGGGAVQIDAQSGRHIRAHETGKNAFGAAWSPGGRAFATDKTEGTLLEIDRDRAGPIARLEVGAQPQQPAVSSSGRIYIPLSGESAIAVVDAAGSPRLLRKIPTGAGTKPHIVSLSPDGRVLYATVQGQDPKLIAIALDGNGAERAVEVRYDLVPRVVAASNAGAFFTAHHSTGLHFVASGATSAETVFVDENGPFSEARKQIEGVAATADGARAAITHEGRKALIVLERRKKLEKICEIAPLDGVPYWVTLDVAGHTAYVSIPELGLVQAFDVAACSSRPAWSAKVGGRPKRMALARGE